MTKGKAPVTGMLASVSTLEEALCAFTEGSDIIDLKAPAAGALGALPLEEINRIAHGMGGRRPISATIGDLPLRPKTVTRAVSCLQRTGIDYIKIGFFPGGDWPGTVEALSRLAAHRLIAVLFADQKPDLTHIQTFAAGGFTGVMLDTLNKAKGSLRQLCPHPMLETFVATARAQGLLCGLAGSLRREDIQPLLALAPDYLGFRGALCHSHQRTDQLDPAAVRAIRLAIPGT